MRKLSVVALIPITILVLTISMFIQPNEINVVVIGVVSYDNKKLSGVSIDVYKNGELLKNVVSQRNGVFGFKLKFNEEYIIEISKKGFITRKIYLSSVVPQTVLTYNEDIYWEPHFYIEEYITGIDISVFEEPVSRYVFSEAEWDFIEDESYRANRRDEMDRVANQFLELKNKKYISSINKADSLYSSSQYENAILAYESAMTYNPGDNYPRKKIRTSQKLIKKQVLNGNAYRDAVKKANGFINWGEFDKSAENYQKELIFRPKGTYSVDKIWEIDFIKPYRWVAEKQAYKEHIRTGDSLYFAGDNARAKESFLKANKLFPKEQYPVIILAKTDSMIMAKKVREEADTISEEQGNQLKLQAIYLEHIIKGDKFANEGRYKKAITAYKKSIEINPKQDYPFEKTAELKKLMKLEEDKEKQEQERINKEYTLTVALADSLLTLTEFENAIVKYRQALNIKTNENYPNKQIKKVERILAEKEKEIEKEEKQKTTAAKSQKEKENTVSKADITKGKDENLKQLMGSLKEHRAEGNKKAESNILNEIGKVFQSEFNLGKAIEFYSQSLNVKRTAGDRKGESEVLTNLASALYDSGNYSSAIEQFDNSLKISEELGDKEQVASILTNMATVHENTYRYTEAVDYLKRSLVIKQELNDLDGVSDIHKNIGNIYYEQDNYQKAADELQKSLEVEKKLDDKEDIEAILNNLGAVYYNMKQYDKSVMYYEKSLQLSQETNNQRDQSITLNNIGNINYDFSRFKKAIEFYERSLKIKTGLSFEEGMATTLHNIGNSYFKLKDNTKALEYYKKSLELAKSTNYKEIIYRNYAAFANVYKALGDFRKAYENYVLYTSSKFEIGSKIAQVIEMREQYESGKIAVRALKRELQKQNRIARYEAEKNKREIEIRELRIENQIQKLRKQQMVIFTFIIGTIIILIFAFVVMGQYRQKRKAFNIVAEQKKQITDSIDYAAKIQQAVLPPTRQIKAILPNCFILNLPRDVVGGDFYWIAKHFDKTIVAVADCTGHGVPGGFMSMLGVTFLNEIKSSEKELQPNEILEQLRERVIDALHQKSHFSESLDGMDISLAIFDFRKKTMQYSGAYHSVYLVRQNKIEIFKGDKNPIGYHFTKGEFKTKDIPLQTGDSIYFTSDGYIDQIGSVTKHRFMISRFKDELLKLNDKTLEQQKEHLFDVLKKWRGSMEQTDDILVVGVKI